MDFSLLTDTSKTDSDFCVSLLWNESVKSKFNLENNDCSAFDQVITVKASALLNCC